ncbi:MAG: phosphomannose isomerase type II C-terminal cupin domain [Parcubacteria group bacterium]
MNPITTTRPWGSFTRYTLNESSTVKLINVKQGEQLSLQFHNNREEFWKVIKGNPEIVIGEETHIAKEGDEFFVGVTVKHRIGAPVDEVVILEIAKGEFDEEDIVRLEDKYNR